MIEGILNSFKLLLFFCSAVRLLVESNDFLGILAVFEGILLEHRILESLASGLTLQPYSRACRAWQLCSIFGLPAQS